MEASDGKDVCPEEAKSNKVTKPKESSLLQICEDGRVVITHTEGELLFGSTDGVFITGLTSDVVNISMDSTEPATNERAGYVASIVDGIGPKDQVEAMLASQIAAVHLATIKASCFFQKSSSMERLDAGERALNRLCRTFTTQMEALKRYRTTGQSGKVRDVNVSDGGQAIIGNVSSGNAG